MPICTFPNRIHWKGQEHTKAHHHARTCSFPIVKYVCIYILCIYIQGPRAHHTTHARTHLQLRGDAVDGQPPLPHRRRRPLGALAGHLLFVVFVPLVLVLVL
jgi:hypothetical protein